MKLALIIIGIVLLVLIVAIGIPVLVYFGMLWAGAPKYVAVGMAILVFVISGVSVKKNA